jgi:hypothetical protein
MLEVCNAMPLLFLRRVRIYAGVGLGLLVGYLAGELFFLYHGLTSSGWLGEQQR